MQLQAYQSKTSIRERYSDDTWISDYNTFDPAPPDFTGPAPEITCSFQKYPTMSKLWNMFWQWKSLSKIRQQTNAYASQIIAGMRKGRRFFQGGVEEEKVDGPWNPWS